MDINTINKARDVLSEFRNAPIGLLPYFVNDDGEMEYVLSRTDRTGVPVTSGATGTQDLVIDGDEAQRIPLNKEGKQRRKLEGYDIANTQIDSAKEAVEEAGIYGPDEPDRQKKVMNLATVAALIEAGHDVEVASPVVTAAIETLEETGCDISRCQPTQEPLNEFALEVQSKRPGPPRLQGFIPVRLHAPGEIKFEVFAGLEGKMDEMEIARETTGHSQYIEFGITGILRELKDWALQTKLVVDGMERLTPEEIKELGGLSPEALPQTLQEKGLSAPEVQAIVSYVAEFEGIQGGRGIQNLLLLAEPEVMDLAHREVKAVESRVAAIEQVEAYEASDRGLVSEAAAMPAAPFRDDVFLNPQTLESAVQAVQATNNHTALGR